MAFLETLPTFFCSEVFRTEDGVAMVVKYGRVSNIDPGRKGVGATFQLQIDFGELAFEDLEAARAVFGADRFQLYRTHWAVREGDAQEVLDRLAVLRPSLAGAVAGEVGQAPAQAEPPPREKDILGAAGSVEAFFELLYGVAAIDGHETVFRGHHDSTFELTPSLMRKTPNGDWGIREQNIYLAIKLGRPNNSDRYMYYVPLSSGCRVALGGRQLYTYSS